jgi:hypothetical protein
VYLGIQVVFIPDKKAVLTYDEDND